MIDGWMISWLKSMETKPFAAGLSLLVVALLMPSSMVGWLFQLFLYFLGVFLVCSTMATNAHQATDFFGRIGLGCVEHSQLILGELPSKLQQGISGGIKGFSDKSLSLVQLIVTSITIVVPGCSGCFFGFFCNWIEWSFSKTMHKGSWPSLFHEVWCESANEHRGFCERRRRNLVPSVSTCIELYGSP